MKNCHLETAFDWTVLRQKSALTETGLTLFLRRACR